MKFFILSCFLIVSSALAQPPSEIPEETVRRLRSLYPHQTPDFLALRVRSAEGAFQKWRSFPPYYYQLLDRMEKTLPNDFHNRQGLCAGDPHLENFGVIFDPVKPVLTVNDLDDVVRCSLNADALRLFIGHRLVMPLTAKEFLDAYREGQAGKSKKLPAYLEELAKDSRKKGMKLSKKVRQLWESDSCDAGEYSSTTTSERSLITRKFSNLRPLKICARVKDSGGSAGAKRFIVLHEESGKQNVFELKPLLDPASMHGENIGTRARHAQFKEAVLTFLGAPFQEHYASVELSGKVFQKRPLWGGNEGVALEDIPNSEIKDVMLYEVYLLGSLHARTSDLTLSLSPEAWETIASAVERKWRTEFGE